MESESDLLKAEREDKERRGLLDVVLKEIHLFNLKQDEEDESTSNVDDDDYQWEESDPTQPHSHPPGIKFFEGNVNCIYNEDSIRPECNLEWLNFQNVNDSSTLETIELMVKYECVLKDLSSKKQVFKYFFKLLFTEQNECFLDSISAILIDIVSKTKHIDVLLEIALKALPLGIQNLGGRVNSIYPEEEIAIPVLPPDIENTQIDYNPLQNFKYVVNVLKYVIVKKKKLFKEKINISVPEIDGLVFFLLVVSHDPLILSSSLIPSIQDFFATVLDLYPSDSVYPEKVQDLVERVGIYWDNSPETFNHHTAYYVTCNVFPVTRRGRHLKASLAYYALMCCLTPDEVEVVDMVHLSRLLKFCDENVEAIRTINFYTLYSVFKLIDAAIERPFDNSRDKEELSHILETMNTVHLSRTYNNDLYNKTKLVAFIREITSEWERLLNKPERKMKQLTVPAMFSQKNSQDDYFEHLP